MLAQLPANEAPTEVLGVGGNGSNGVRDGRTRTKSGGLGDME